MTEQEITRRALTAIRRFDNLRISGPGWSGNSREGFAFNPESGVAGFAGGGPPPPPTVSGACCYEDGTCSVVTQEICESGGGTYQGDDTTCEEADCPQPPPTGACCVGTDCTIETEDDCIGIGGTYQGDDTTCDPNPCEMPPCNDCGFDAFDMSGRKFLTKTEVYHYTQISGCCEPFSGCGQCAVDGTITTTSSYDSECNLTVITDPESPLFPTTGGCPGHCDGGFINILLAPQCTPATISATVQSCTAGRTFDCETCSNPPGGSDTFLEITITLSNECTPP